MKWLITGGTGQLARSLTDLLDRESINFVSLSRLDLDISDAESVDRIVSHEPQIIVNCAAFTDVEKAEIEQERALRVNKWGARNTAISAKKLGVPLIHISTDYVFSGDKNSPWLTNDETKPNCFYGLSKREGEKEILQVYSEGSFILRTAWLYGPYGKNFAKTILKRALVGDSEIKVVGDQVGQPTSSLSLASQIIAISKSDLGSGIYHATNSGQASWFEFAKTLVEHAGLKDSTIVPIESSSFYSGAKRPKYSVLDQSKWSSVAFPVMDHWMDALEEVFPRILASAKRELRYGGIE